MIERTPITRHLPARAAMAIPGMPLSYAAAASGSSKPSRNHARQQSSQAAASVTDVNATPKARTPSPDRHRPRGVPEDEAVYVVTLLTDRPHHDRMTRLRTRYFPRHINKLDAHLTLFHALPGSKLKSSIIPTLQDVAQQTTPFKILATKPFRLKYGIAISVAKTQGVMQAQAVHAALQQRWLDQGFLSEQDRGGCRIHYTIMNKVDDEFEVLKAFGEVQDSFEPDSGTAEGLGLWRYDRGWWRWERRFDFGG
ncbi:hypothetical protein LTR53_005977 [Teratosphaeriaceae sp. CCFEE 6253]|nr:hypothetical protein LTR53_005977 [Teratosphaeriaceae sp. CCFEE 6253]